MPLVPSASGLPQSVSSRSRWARSSTGMSYHARSPSLIRWHWHFAARAAPEHRLQVIPARLVGGHHGHIAFRHRVVPNTHPRHSASRPPSRLARGTLA